MKSTVNGTGAKRFIVLDSWRGVCSLLVAIHHFFLSTINNYDTKIVSSFSLFVDFFFVLSGFVIASRYRGDIGSLRAFVVFILKRLARIWPLHACVMMAFAIFIGYLVLAGVPSPFTIGASPTTYDIRKFPLVLALTNSFGLYAGGWNLPSWSISAELCAYIVFGAAFLFRRNLLLVTSVAIASGLFIWIRGGDYLSGMTASYGAIRCLFGFSLGVISQYIYKKYNNCNFFSGRLGGGFYTFVEISIVSTMVIYLLASTGAEYAATPASVAIPLIFAAVILSFAPERGGISRFLKMKYPVKLGEISYSVYMVHWLVLIVMAHLATSAGVGRYVSEILWGNSRWFWDLSNDSQFISMVVVFVTTVVVISLFTFRYVEDPCRRLGSRYAEKVGAAIDLAQKKR